MATFKEVLIKALQDGNCRIDSINKNLKGVSKGTKKRNAVLNIATNDEIAEGYMLLKQKNAGFMIHIDGDYLNQLSDEIDLKNLKGADANAS